MCLCVARSFMLSRDCLFCLLSSFILAGGRGSRPTKGCSFFHVTFTSSRVAPFLVSGVTGPKPTLEGLSLFLVCYSRWLAYRGTTSSFHLIVTIFIITFIPQVGGGDVLHSICFVLCTLYVVYYILHIPCCISCILYSALYVT